MPSHPSHLWATEDCTRDFQTASQKFSPKSDQFISPIPAVLSPQIQYILSNGLAVAIREDSLLPQDETKHFRLAGKLGDNIGVEKRRTEHIGFAPNNHDSSPTGLENSGQFLKCITHVDAILNHSIKSVASIGAVRADFRPGHAQQIPPKQLD